MQLSSVDDYKASVLLLLVKLADCNLVKAMVYGNYFAKIFYDARVELKKQLAKEEKIMEQEDKRNDVPVLRYSFGSANSNFFEPGDYYDSLSRDEN